MRDPKFNAKLKRFLEKSDGSDPKESVIEAKWNTVAKNLGWRNRKLQTVQQNGDPDRIYFRYRECLLIEYKRKGRKPTELQLKRHEEWRKDGFTVLVIDCIDAQLAGVVFL